MAWSVVLPLRNTAGPDAEAFGRRAESTTWISPQARTETGWKRDRDEQTASRQRKGLAGRSVVVRAMIGKPLINTGGMVVMMHVGRT